MSSLLHLAEREVRKIHVKHEQLNGTSDIKVYLDWGRDGEEDLQLLTTLKSVPNKIVQKLCGNRRYYNE